MNNVYIQEAIETLETSLRKWGRHPQEVELLADPALCLCWGPFHSLFPGTYHLFCRDNTGLETRIVDLDRAALVRVLAEAQDLLHLLREDVMRDACSDVEVMSTLAELTRDVEGLRS